MKPLRTISEIVVGCYVVTVYDEKPLWVVHVNYERDEFNAVNTEDREIWERLTSDDVIKVMKPLPKDRPEFEKRKPYKFS